MKGILLAGLFAALTIATAAPARGEVIRTGSGDRCSGTITTGGVSQVAANGDMSRNWLYVQNPISATEPLFVDFGPNHQASPTLSTQLAPGGSISFLSGVVPGGQVNVSAATAGHAFICETGR